MTIESFMNSEGWMRKRAEADPARGAQGGLAGDEHGDEQQDVEKVDDVGEAREQRVVEEDQDDAPSGHADAELQELLAVETQRLVGDAGGADQVPDADAEEQRSRGRACSS